MTKATTDNDKNISTKIVTATVENELGSEEVSGEWVWKSFTYFDALFYGKKKIFPEKTLLYVNQAFVLWIW